MRSRLTLLVLQFPKDSVEGAHLGLEWLHQLGTDEDWVLVRSELSHQGYLGLGHVVVAQPAGYMGSFPAIDRITPRLKRFWEARMSMGKCSALLGSEKLKW